MVSYSRGEIFTTTFLVGTIVKDAKILNVESNEEEISNLMIIGDSDSALNFSMSIQNVAEFTRVLHVLSTDFAIKLLLEEEFPLIVLDYDGNDWSIIHFTNLVRRYLPLSRIMVISTEVSVNIIRTLINDASVDAFLPVPIDDYSAYSMILEQQAKYQINSMLNQLVTVDPPKFSQSYYLMHDPKMSSKIKERPKFQGLVITRSSITRYMQFVDDFFNKDEYLITGYISAISMLGEELFQQDSHFEEINLAGTSIILHFYEDIQFLFFFSHLSKHNFQQLEHDMNSIINGITEEYYNLIKSNKPFPLSVVNRIDYVIKALADKQEDYVDTREKQHIILFGNQLPKLNSILKRKTGKYRIYRYMSTKDLLYHLVNEQTDVIVMNQVLYDDKWNYTLAAHAKEIDPSISIIALLKELTESFLLKILNDEQLDFALGYSDSEETIETYFDAAAERARAIKSSMEDFQPHNLQFTSNRVSMAKTRLRKYKDAFEQITIPELVGIFIIKANEPYYRNFWSESEAAIHFDDKLLAGFINSLDLFTEEIFDSQEDFSGLKFGDVHLLVKKQFEFDFIYFMANLDHTNTDTVDLLLERHSEMLFEQIINTEDFDEASIKINQQMTELYMKFVGLNFE